MKSAKYGHKVGKDGRVKVVRVNKPGKGLAAKLAEAAIKRATGTK